MIEGYFKIFKNSKYFMNFRVCKEFQIKFYRAMRSYYTITIEIITIVFRLPIEGDDLIVREQYNILLDKFHQRGELRDMNYITTMHIQGVKRNTLLDQWEKVALWIIKFLTYEEYHEMIMGHHLNLLTNMGMGQN